MTAASAGGVTDGGEWAWRSSPESFRPFSSIQREGLLVFLILSAIDVAVSAFLFFGGGHDYIEANPVLAWSTGSLVLFLVAVLTVKAIGAGMLALLTYLGNRFSSYVGDAVVLAAVGTTTALFLFQFVA